MFTIYVLTDKGKVFIKNNQVVNLALPELPWAMAVKVSIKS